MNTYIFRTVSTMKPYNNKNWWINGDVVKEKRIMAENLNDALSYFSEMVENEEYITISKNALKNRSPMYIDTTSGEPKQVGFVITGKMEFQRDSGEWVNQYIDLWVEILPIVDTDF